MISGTGVLMRTNDEDRPVSFVRNEYVLAKDRNEAFEAAKKKTYSRLSSNKGVILPATGLPELKLEEIEENVPLWKLTSDESFIFYDPI
jgi:hypothetical protein